MPSDDPEHPEETDVTPKTLSKGPPILPPRLRAGTAVLLAVGLAVMAELPSHARPSRPAGRRAASQKQAAPTPAPRPALSLAQRCHFVPATPEELTQFHNELQRQGWAGAYRATVPTRYAIRNDRVEPLDPHFATFLGDVDGDGQPERVVGYYFDPEPQNADGSSGTPAGPATRGPQDDRARIVVFKKDSEGHWRFRWRSPGLGNRFEVPQPNLDEVQQGLDLLQNLNLPLALTDVNRDGRLEIIYYCVSQFEAIGALPGVLRCVRNRTGEDRWVNVAPHADRFSVRDVDQDGTLEVVVGSRRVGYGSGDDDVPRVWRWSGTQFQEASRAFPRFYAALTATYRAYVLRMRADATPFDHVVWQRAIDKATSLSG